MSQLPARAASLSSPRRIARLVLVIGIVVAVAAGFGPVWAVRSGIVIAAVAGVVACLYAWREATAERRAGTSALLATSREQRVALTAERTRNADVVDVLAERVAVAHRKLAEQQRRVADLRGTVNSLGGTVAGLRGTATTLREDLAAVRMQLGERDATIDALRDVVASREAELQVLTSTTEGYDAEVHAWPRHVRTEVAADQGAAANGELPTVVDLRAVDTQLAGISNYEPVVRSAQQG